MKKTILLSAVIILLIAPSANACGITELRCMDPFHIVETTISYIFKSYNEPPAHERRSPVNNYGRDDCNYDDYQMRQKCHERLDRNKEYEPDSEDYNRQR